MGVGIFLWARYPCRRGGGVCMSLAGRRRQSGARVGGERWRVFEMVRSVLPACSSLGILKRTQGFTADPDYWKGEVFVYVGSIQNLKDLKESPSLLHRDTVRASYNTCSASGRDCAKSLRLCLHGACPQTKQVWVPHKHM